MTTLHKTAQQAREALCCVRDMVAHPDNLEFIDKHITALKAALAEPVQEPVAWMDPNSGEVCRANWLESHAPERDVDRFTCALYTAPPQRKENNDD